MTVRYDDIRSANYGIQTTDIKGKDYVPVNQRVIAFVKVFPMGFIDADIIQLDDSVCVMKAQCGYYENGQRFVLGTGHAREEKGSSYINKGSYVENCETSAVGRALGMAGFGIDASMASYDEVANAIENQEKAVDLEKKYIKLTNQLRKMDVDIHDDETVIDYIKDKASVNTLDHAMLSTAELNRVIGVFEEIIKKKSGE